MFYGLYSTMDLSIPNMYYYAKLMMSLILKMI